MKHPYLYMILLLLVVNQTANAVMACCLIDSQLTAAANVMDEQSKDTAMPCHGESDELDVLAPEVMTEVPVSQPMCDDCQDCMQLTLIHEDKTADKLLIDPFALPLDSTLISLIKFSFLDPPKFSS